MSEPATSSERICTVLKTVGIKRAVFVDDMFRPSWETAIATSIGLAAPDTQAPLTDAWGGVGTWSSDSGDEDREKSKTRWDGMDFAARKKLLEILGIIAKRKVGATAPFDELWPQTEIPLDGIAPEEFTPNYLSALAQSGPALLFIDLSFDDDEGGIGILKQVFQGPAEARPTCAILTNKVQSNPSEELAKWDALVEKHGLEPSAGLVISKEKIAEPDVLGNALRRAFVNSLAPNMLKWGLAVAQAAFTKVFNSFKIDGDVLDAVVLRSSEREGIHPTETLFRLIDAEFRHERENTSLSEPALTEFREVQAKLAALAGLRSGQSTDDKEVKVAVKKWRRDELYRRRLEIAGSAPASWLGDIWEVDLPGKDKAGNDVITTGVFTLIAQPCDIILRSDGSRSQEWALLAPVSAKEPPSAQREVFVELPYFDAETYKSHWLSLKRARLADTRILDAVAVAGSGIVRADIPQLMSFPHVHASVAARMKIIGDWMGVALSSPSALDRLALFLDDGPAARISISDTEVVFAIRRVGRVEPELARLLLQRLGTFVARPALPHDFAVQ